MIDFED